MAFKLAKSLGKSRSACEFISVTFLTISSFLISKTLGLLTRRNFRLLNIVTQALLMVSFSHAETPNNPAIMILDRNVVNRGFLEIAPIVTEVIVKKGDPFVEVFINGEVPEGDCYDKKEFVVENEKELTRIFARFKRLNPEAPCNSKQKTFSEKVADLDPSNPSSRVVEVLGYYGWSRGELALPEQK